MNILSSLAAGLAAGDMRNLKRRLRNKTVFATAIGILLVTFYVAGLAAIGLALVPVLGPLGAAIAIAGSALGLALLLIGAAMIAERVSRRKRVSTERALVTNTALAVAPALVRSSSPLGLLIAGGLAYVAADVLQGRQSR